MISKTVKTLSAATALAALAGGFIGAGTANAQMSSSGPADIEGWTHMGWSAFSGSVINKGGNYVLLRDLPAGAKPLTGADAKAAIAGPLNAKGDGTISLSFGQDGKLSFYDGCNAGSAPYTLDDGGTVKAGNLAVTQRLCDPTTMNKSDEVKAMLQAKPAVYRIDKTTVALVAKGKALELVK